MGDVVCPFGDATHAVPHQASCPEPETGLSVHNRPRRTTRLWRGLAAALAPALVVAGILVPTAPAQAAVLFNVACGDIYGINGLVNMMDIANRNPGDATVSLAAGCTYVVDTPAWDYVGADRVDFESAFWPINDRHAHS